MGIATERPRAGLVTYIDVGVEIALRRKYFLSDAFSYNLTNYRLVIEMVYRYIYNRIYLFFCIENIYLPWLSISYRHDIYNN